MLHLGSLRGTSIDVDFSFILLIVLFVANNYDANLGVHYALLWAPVLFISVLVHELAHAATIGLFGYGSSAIILGGMGGVTVNRRAARPWQDMIISLAGPLSSFLLAWGVSLLRTRSLFVQRDPMLYPLTQLLVWANVVWGLLNLIPVPPLDGGHAVRQFFRIFFNERTAFVIAVWIAMVVGAAIAISAAARRDIFFAVLIGWFTFMSFRSWQHFREHGVPGD